MSGGIPGGNFGNMPCLGVIWTDVKGEMPCGGYIPCLFSHIEKG
jgi:hypothetical protein